MRKTFTVALVGADGAGKTTIAKRLLDSSSVPMKYIYMGPSIESSNISLPTSRLILALKLRAYRKQALRLEHVPKDFLSTQHPEHRKDRRGSIGAVLRLLHRAAEAWYRQTVAWGYQLRGFVVLYDRHFLFEAANSGSPGRRFTDRVHYWHLRHVFPKPDLVILLEAPPETLWRRKGEATVELLEKYQAKYLEQGSELPNFVRVDATQPLDSVVAVVSDHVTQFRSRWN